MKIKCLLLVFFCILTSFAYGQWVWTRETGWTNPQYTPRGTAKKLLENGQKLRSQKRTVEALEIFTKLFKYFPNTPEAEQALFLAAEIRYKRKEYDQADLLYGEYLEKYPNSPKLKIVLEKKYEIGALIIRDKVATVHPEVGVESLEKVIQTSPYTSFADDAQLTIANYYFKSKKYVEARDAYSKLVKDYPKSEWRKFANYQIAICLFLQYREPPYDPTPLLQAEQKLKLHIKKHKNNYNKKELARVQKKHLEMREKMAKKEMYVAQHYINRGHIHSARLYLKLIRDQFPKTKTALRARFILKNLKD